MPYYSTFPFFLHRDMLDTENKREGGMYFMEYERPERLTVRLESVVLDCPNAHELAVFYSKLLGWPIARETPEFSAVIMIPRQSRGYFICGHSPLILAAPK